MKRFEFRLARVLKLKRQREQLAEIRQKQARAALDAAQAMVAAQEQRLAETADTLAAHLGQALASLTWIALHEQSVQLSRLVQEAEAQEKQAAQKLQEAETQRTQMKQEVEALLFLRRQQWQAYQHDLARAQQEQLDELALVRWKAGTSRNHAQQESPEPLRPGS